MNYSDKKLTFSIRKFKLGIASAVIGVSFFGPTSMLVGADELAQEVASSLVSHTVAENAEAVAEVLASGPDIPSEVVGLESEETSSTEDLVLLDNPDLAAPTLAQQFSALVQDVTVSAARDVYPSDLIANAANLPQGTSYEWLTAPDLLQPGQSQQLRIRVRYTDGSSQELTARLTLVPAQAQQQIPAAQTKELLLGQSLQPVDLIANASSLPAGTQYTWEVKPNLSSVGGKFASVLVTYPDGSSELVSTRVLVNRRQATVPKKQPTLIWQSLVPSEEQLSAVASYQLTDPNQAFLGARVMIYDGATKVSETLLTKADLAGKTLIFPEWSKNYTVKTTLMYDVGSGQWTTDLPDKTLEFELKKLEIKDIDTVALYRQDSHHATQIERLASAPTDVSPYFVRITSDRFRDMLLPVKSINLETLATGESAYRVTTDVLELVEDTDLSQASSYKDQFSFYIPHVSYDAATTGVYTSFSELVRAMQSNPTGQFTLGADLFADEVNLSDDDETYVTNQFSGTLIGQLGERQFTIHNLKAPLFSTLFSASVRQLDLKGVNINRDKGYVGALAKIAIATNVYDLAVQGLVSGSYNVGGLVADARLSEFNQIQFTGQVKTTSPYSVYEIGGLASFAENVTIKNARLDVTVSVEADNESARVGGLIGHVKNSRQQSIENIAISGQVIGKKGHIGGLIGDYESGRLSNIVSAVAVTNGQMIYGTKTGSAFLTNVRAVEGKAAGTTQVSVSSVSPESAQTIIDQMGLIATQSEPTRGNYSLSTDYTTLKNAQPERVIAYDNIEKLIPFYNKEQIIKYGNLVPQTDKLYITRLLSVTPMRNQTVVSDVYAAKRDLNRLMLHYEDGTVAYLALRYHKDFRNQAISEYKILGTELIYTPEQFLSSYDHLVNQILPSLQLVNYEDYAGLDDIIPYTEEDIIRDLSLKVAEHMNDKRFGEEAFLYKSTITYRLVEYGFFNWADASALTTRLENELKASYKATSSGRKLQMERLYLESTFNNIKQQLPSILTSLLATDKSINTSVGAVSQYIVHHINQNKEKLLLGLAYMQRWYNIDFETIDIKDLATYHQDFHGKQVNTIDWLIELGSSYENLRASNNLATYRNYLAQQTGHAEVYDYLSANRQTFLPEKDDNTWFKEATNAFIVEEGSQINPSHQVSLYHLLSNQEEGNGLLPLLTAREGVFIMATMGSLTYGMYDRYYDDTDLAGLSRPEKIERIKDKVRQAARAQAEHIDVWYRLLSEDVRQKLIKSVPIWDGYMVNGTVLPKHGSQATPAILDFFGPVGARSNALLGSGVLAYAQRGKIAYVSGKILSESGLSTFTHEFVHIHDGTYLNDYGTRGGLEAEAYARGLLQSNDYAYETDSLSLNLIFDHSAYRDQTNRYTNISPDRFRTKDDLKDYMSGVFDVLYTLDYAEAQEASKLSTSAKQVLYGVIENYFNSSEPNHAGNSVRELRLAEAERLTNWERFVDLNIVSRRQYDIKRYERDGYYKSYLFTPNYAALSNSKGAPGDVMFRRIAFELLADKGYDEGFVPYASDQLGANASDKTKDWHLKEVGLVTDDMVLRHIYGDSYATWADAKKAMFRQRIEKLDKLRPVTITYQGNQETIRSYQDIERLMISAMAYDSRYHYAYHYSSRVRELKAAIFNAYLRQTDDFRTSIYNP